MTYQTAKQIATQLAGRTPRWCDVRDENDEHAPAPVPEAMDDCIALNADGGRAIITRWVDQRPFGADVEAVCYF